MAPKSLYLAHPTSTRKTIRKWELAFEKRTGINLDNPFYDKEIHDVERVAIDMMDKGLLQPNTVSNRGYAHKIVAADLKQIQKNDGIVAIVEKCFESLGTPMEIFYNSHVLKRPTYVITDTMDGHPWILSLATEIFKDVRHFEQYVKEGFK